MELCHLSLIVPSDKDRFDVNLIETMMDRCNQRSAFQRALSKRNEESFRGTDEPHGDLRRDRCDHGTCQHDPGNLCEQD